MGMVSMSYFNEPAKLVYGLYSKKRMEPFGIVTSKMFSMSFPVHYLQSYKFGVAIGDRERSSLTSDSKGIFDFSSLE